MVPVPRWSRLKRQIMVIYLKEMSEMDFEYFYKLARGYSFLARNIIGGKMVNAALEALAFMDYRMLIMLSMWHPDHDTRIKLLRKRGVNVGEKVFLEQGVWIEITMPQSVVLEDYTGVSYGAVILAHDATPNKVVGLPVRVKETRLKRGAGVGMHSMVMAGVTFGEFSYALPGSVVTKDVPEGMVVAGNPAEVVFSVEDVFKNWQQEMKRHPDIFYDYPDNPWLIPSTPFDHLITWREEGIRVRDSSELRTGTPFDYILDAKSMKKAAPHPGMTAWGIPAGLQRSILSVDKDVLLGDPRAAMPGINEFFLVPAQDLVCLQPLRGRGSPHHVQTVVPEIDMAQERSLYLDSRPGHQVDQVCFDHRHLHGLAEAPGGGDRPGKRVVARSPVNAGLIGCPVRKEEPEYLDDRAFFPGDDPLPTREYHGYFRSPVDG